MEAELNQALEHLYNDPASPAGFAGVQRLWEEARKQFPGLRKSDVREWLRGHRAYTLHHPQRLRFPRSRTVPAGYMTDVQADLADMQQIAQYNRGAKYILVAIDVLSKQVFAVPTQSKSSAHMVDAFQRLFDQMPMKPHRLFTDKGKEFENREVKQLFDEVEIEKHRPNSSVTKASIAERCIRQIRQRLARYFTQNQTMKWIDVLPDIVHGINNARSRVHGMAPSEIGFHNAQRVWERVFGPRQRYIHPGGYVKKKPKYQKDDFVRMSKNRGAFHRGYWPHYSDEILEIDAAKKNAIPNRYKVRDASGELFDGYIYESDLQKVRPDPNVNFRIERRIRTRRRPDGSKEWLCKFYDDPNLYWLDESYFA